MESLAEQVVDAINDISGRHEGTGRLTPRALC